MTTKKWTVILTAYIEQEIEVEADTQDEAVEIALADADDNVRFDTMNCVDWSVDDVWSEDEEDD